MNKKNITFNNKKIIIESANDIPTNYITKMQTPETDEAIKLFNNKNKIFEIIKIILIIINFLIIGLQLTNIIENYDKFQNYIYPLFISILLLTITNIITIKIIKNKLKPYKDLLEIAKSNDLIRHKKRIEIREEDRIYNEIKNKNTTEK